MKRLSLVQYSAIGLIFTSLLMYYVYYSQTGNFNSPIIEYEFVQNQQDVKNIFIENNELKQDVILGIKNQNIVDYVFMILYTSLLVLAFAEISKSEKKKIYTLGIIFSFTALIGDIFENIQLFQISELLLNRTDFSHHVDLLFIITRVKWLSLAFALFILSSHYYKYKFLGKLFSLISALPFLNILTFIILSNNTDDNFYTIFTNFIMLGFVVLIIWIFIPENNKGKIISFYNSGKSQTI